MPDQPIATPGPPDAADTVFVENLPVLSQIGVTEEERATAQTLLVSVRLALDLRPAAETDDLTQTVDYAALRTRIVETAAAKPRRLLETLAEELGRLALNDTPHARSVDVKIVKPAVSTAGETLGVHIRRRRPHTRPDA